MLTATGFLTIFAVLAVLLANRASAVVALILVPVIAAFVAGFGVGEVGDFITAGLEGVVGVTALFVFAILYFGIMRDAGMFDPIIDRILSFAGRNPITITLATAALAIVTHLDGAGATSFLITIPAMLPLYDALGMSRLVLATVTGLGVGAMNLVPWGGPTARAGTTVGVDPNVLWVPLIPAQIVGLISVFGIAYYLGRRERRRLIDEGKLGNVEEDTSAEEEPAAASNERSEEQQALVRPNRFWINVALTVLVVVTLIAGIAPSQVIFMIALVLALIINYPGLQAQQERIDAHARGAILMASTLLAAGAFLGILEESGMIDGMAQATAGALPSALAPLFPIVVGVVAVPLSLLFGPDPYYFGVLPVLTSVAEQFGVSPIAMAQASIIGEETVGFPISPLTGSFYLLVGLSGVRIGDHIRHMFPWAWLVSLIMLAVAVISGVIPLWAA
jgi:CitMHS family citrate-Mg2+:H+ or citrate-Ca2+:H+ symporter